MDHRAAPPAPARRPPRGVLAGVAVLLAVLATAAAASRPSVGAVSVFADDEPTVARLDPGLRDALRRAAIEAEADGVELRVTSGWRSPEHQQQLWDEAVDEHGSAGEAARWVARPGSSAHETGDAVDVGPAGAAAWLAEHGAAHGLCPIYANEPWHIELRPEAIDHGCPAPYADPTEDPRRQP